MVEYIDYERCAVCDEKFEAGPYACPRCGQSVRNTWWQHMLAGGVFLALGGGIVAVTVALWRCMT